ncbi:MAG: DEAD/DEAH box helicase, partial [bacterium]|nr:DEAD/DEAH box helicase [Candidatus Colisoma equi]
MKLRDYQETAIQKILESWQKFRSCLIVLPTGCGKTVVFGELIHRLLTNKVNVEGEQWIGQDSVRAMVLAHREELISQAADKVGRISGADVQVEMGEMKVSPMFGQMPHVVVSTVQTQCAPLGGKVKVEGEGEQRMSKFCPDDFGVLVIDEAHHATAKTYRSCIEHYLSNPKCRLLGVTATPDRADESALGSVFDTVAFEYTVTEAIHDGWLVPVKQRLVKVGSLDFSKVSSCAGDFNQGELAQVLEEEQNLHAIAAPTMEICGNRRAIIFAASVKQAERLAEILNRGKSEELRGKSEDGSTQDRAAWVCGMTPKDERRTILEDFKAGRVQYLVNVGVLTEGYDDAGVEVVVMARPTKSRALYAQMAGRATRPSAKIASLLGEGPSDECRMKSDEWRRKLIAESDKPVCTIL